MLLRPTALVIAALAVFSLKSQNFMQFKVIWVLFGATVLLTGLHLAPLPFAWWSKLPGRDVIVAIDQVAGLGQIARPLSMSPDATVNALTSLSIPFAVLLLAVQLNELEHQYILLVVIALATLSGVVGLLQASGAGIEFYPLSTQTSGLFANRNHQGALLALMLPMAAAVSVLGFGSLDSAKARVLLSSGLAVIVVPLILVTGSRSAILLLGVAFLFALLIWTSGRKAAQNWKLRFAAPFALSASALGLVGLTVWASRDVAIDRLQASGEDLRWPVWQSIIEMLTAYLPWGTGIGSYAEAYQIREPDELLRPTQSNHAHNEVLEIALTAGVPGLMLLAVAVGILVITVWQVFGRNAPITSSATLGRLGCTIAVLLVMASMTDYPTRTPILASILMLASVWASLSRNSVQITPQIQGWK